MTQFSILLTEINTRENWTCPSREGKEKKEFENKPGLNYRTV